MNNELSRLHPYPFEKLAALKSGMTPPENLPHIALSMGEPQHPAPAIVIESLIAHMHQLSSYPSTRGSIGLRESIAAWLTRRFKLKAGLIDTEKHILPVNGTREALFAIAQCVIDRSRQGATMFMPNPFYQIYEGAAILAGAEPVYLNCIEENNYLPDLDRISDTEWANCQMIYLCNPGNPTGAVMPVEYQQRLITLAQHHDFVIVSDECYSEIYFDEAQPPPGLLEVAAGMGIDDFNRCLVFHSLSKRSNLPGLRSGFVAGDAQIIKNFLLYRTYHGCSMPPATQTASAVAWADEDHVIENRRRYRVKFEQVLSLLSATLAPQKPQAGFYLWAKTPVADTEFARRLFAEQNVTVLPGQYLSRNNADGNPGENRVRMALVAPLEECVEAAHRINSLFRPFRRYPMSELQQNIEQAFENRAEITPANVDAGVKNAVETAIALLDSGEQRVAEPTASGWQVNEWLKKAVLLSFRIRDNEIMAGGSTQYYDKVDSKFAGLSAEQHAASGVRVVPPAMARKGAFVAPGVVLMPSYVNIGAYVDSGTMVDTWATVGSCAQIGKNVHLSGGVGIGGVLEPLQASPTIIEDNCFIGARSEVVEGVIVEKNSVISMGVYIGQSTKIYNRETGEVSYGRIPEGSVVVSGNLPSSDGSYSLYCAVIVKQVDAKTRSKVGINDLLRNI